MLASSCMFILLGLVNIADTVALCRTAVPFLSWNILRLVRASKKSAYKFPHNHTEQNAFDRCKLCNIINRRDKNAWSTIFEKNWKLRFSLAVIINRNDFPTTTSKIVVGAKLKIIQWKTLSEVQLQFKHFIFSICYSTIVDIVHF